jgi:hypothetical protein
MCSIFGSRGGYKKAVHNSTEALRVVGGDQKGSIESETVKYGHESHETQTRK